MRRTTRARWQPYDSICPLLPMLRQDDRASLYAKALASPPLSPSQGVVETFSSRKGLQRSFRIRVPPPEGAMHDVIREAHATVLRLMPACRGGDDAYEKAMKVETARLLTEKGIFWSRVWPAGLALGLHLLEESDLCTGRSVLELGAGLGIGAVCAAVAGASLVVATDIAPKGLAFAKQSVVDNGLDPGTSSFKTATWDWNEPPPPGLAGPYDVVLAGDVIYTDEHAPRLGQLLLKLVKPRGVVLFSDSLERPYKLSHQSDLCRRLSEAGFVQTLCKDVDVDASVKLERDAKRSLAAGNAVRLLQYSRTRA